MKVVSLSLVLLAVILVLGLVVPSEGQNSPDDAFDHAESRYLQLVSKADASSKDRDDAAGSLSLMFDISPLGAFPRIRDALASEWPALRLEAAFRVRFYYVDGNLSWLRPTRQDWPQEVLDSKEAVRKRLRVLAGEHCADVRVRALASLTALEPMTTDDVNALCDIVSGDVLDRQSICTYVDPHAFTRVRDQALQTLLGLEAREHLRVPVREGLQAILNRQRGSSDEILEQIRKALGEEGQEQGKRSKSGPARTTWECDPARCQAYRVDDAVQYAYDWYYRFNNAGIPQLCEPFQAYEYDTDGVWRKVRPSNGFSITV
jgi:hypothetical protein